MVHTIPPTIGTPAYPYAGPAVDTMAARGVC